MPDYGVAGSTRRYALIVAMLVGLSSAPALAVVAIGSAAIRPRDPGPGTVPLLGPSPEVPVVVVPTGPDGGGPGTGGGAHRVPPPPRPLRPDATLAAYRVPAGRPAPAAHANPAVPAQPVPPSTVPPSGSPRPGRPAPHRTSRNHGRRDCDDRGHGGSRQPFDRRHDAASGTPWRW